jgi:NADH dehydrogenase FAD-containing subunit
MFTRNLKSAKNFHFSTYKNFSNNHSEIVIIGAGTGGISLAKQILRNNIVNPNKLTIFDPSKIHHYQPSWTQIGGLPNKLNLVKKSVFEIEDLIGEDSNIKFQNVGIRELDPDNNLLKDENGEEWTYDQLIVACGIKINHNSIPGFYNKKIFLYTYIYLI